MKPVHARCLLALLLLFAPVAHAEPVEGWVPARDAIPLAPTLNTTGEQPPNDSDPIIPTEVEGQQTIADELLGGTLEEATPAPTSDHAIPSDLPPPGEEVGEGDALIRVKVRGQEGENYDAPLGNRVVELSVIRPPHQVLSTLIAVTGDDGTARFAVPSGPGLQAFARNLVDGKELFAPVGAALDLPGEHALEIQDIPIVQDPSVVFASRVITIAELWEDYIVFTQVFSLATDQQVIFEAALGGRDSGLRIPLPDGAAGVRVVQPQDKAESVGDAVMFRGQILPAGQASEAPTMIVRYSLQHSNTKSVSWTQDFPFDVENLSIVVPQTSQHDRHPHLNVDIDVPLCGDAETLDPRTMCFAEFSDSAEGVQMLQGAAVRLARGGRVSAGGTMAVTTTGWPADPHIARWSAGIALALAALIGWLLYRRTARRSEARQDGLARLEREKEAILSRVDSLEVQLAEAAILEMDYEAERERIIGELALIERRIRSYQSPQTHA